MISPDYCQMMARYNAWQNTQLTAILDTAPQDVIYGDHGVFFGSVFGTLNHILWADTIWLSRFGDFPAPHKPGSESTTYSATYTTWQHARRDMDKTILAWAQTVTQADLVAEMTWKSGLTGKTASAPLWQNVTHFFNHQTHHRGQIHAVLTRFGSVAPVSDIPFLPDPDM